MKEKIKKIGSTVVKVLAFVLLLFFAVVFILSKVSGSPVFLFGKTTMWVITDSMSPTIPARSYILVEKASPDEIEVGDVIAFVSTDPQIYGQINTHRVVRIEGDTFVTKGDNNSVEDGAYSAKAENVVGRYVRTLPVMTFLGRIVLSQVGFMLVIIVFLAVTLICYVPEMKEALKKKEAEESGDKQEEINRLVQEEIKKLMENGLPEAKDRKQEDEKAE